MSDEKKFCINCGKEIPAAAAFCPVCSAWQLDVIPKPAPAVTQEPQSDEKNENEVTYVRKTYQKDPNVKGLTQVYKGQEIDIKDLEEKAYKDQPTGLYNRQKLNEVKQTIKANDVVTIISIDINNLKKVNDTYGHSRGDQLINNMAAVLKEVCPGEAYRTGGDEFLILLFNKTEDEADVICNSIREQLEKRKEDPKNGFVPTAAIGYVQKQDGETYESAFNRADKIMYETKRKMKAQSLSSVTHDGKHKGSNLAEMEYNEKKNACKKIIGGKISEMIILVFLIGGALTLKMWLGV